MGCTTTPYTPQKITSVNQNHQIQEQGSALAISQKMEFWTVQRKGANGLLENYRSEYFSEAKKAGLQYVRFGPNLLPANEKDFLIGFNPPYI